MEKTKQHSKGESRQELRHPPARCPETHQSHRHLRCKYQYCCGEKHHSHRHPRCKHQYNCDDASQLSHAFKTTPHSPLWRAYRTHADGCERLRTVADGCGRLRTVADGCEHRHKLSQVGPQYLVESSGSTNCNYFLFD